MNYCEFRVADRTGTHSSSEFSSSLLLRSSQFFCRSWSIWCMIRSVRCLVFMSWSRYSCHFKSPISYRTKKSKNVMPIPPCKIHRWSNLIGNIINVNHIIMVCCFSNFKGWHSYFSQSLSLNFSIAHNTSLIFTSIHFFMIYFFKVTFSPREIPGHWEKQWCLANNFTVVNF